MFSNWAVHPFCYHPKKIAGIYWPALYETGMIFFCNWVPWTSLRRYTIEVDPAVSEWRYWIGYAGYAEYSRLFWCNCSTDSMYIKSDSRFEESDFYCLWYLYPLIMWADLFKSFRHVIYVICNGTQLSVLHFYSWKNSKIVKYDFLRWCTIPTKYHVCGLLERQRNKWL